MDFLLLFLLVLLALPLWMSFRNNKQIRKIRDMQDRLAPGAAVVTNAGIHGIVHDVAEDTVDILVADGVVIRIQKMAVVRNVTEEENAADAKEAVAASAQARDEAAAEAHQDAQGNEVSDASVTDNANGPEATEPKDNSAAADGISDHSQSNNDR